MKQTRLIGAIEVLEKVNEVKKILRTQLFEELEDRPATNRAINWDYSYKFAKKMNLISLQRDYVLVTKSGINILNFKRYETSAKLTNYIFRECIFHNKEFFKTKIFLEKFHMIDNNLILDDEDVKNEDYDEINLLQELDIITFEDVWKIREDINDLIFVNRKNVGKRIITQDEIDEIKMEQKRVGECAENLSLEFEKNEFRKKKWKEEMIEQISKDDAGAGYDINSIWGKNSKISDKFIEVKGRKYDENSFIISHNELEKAREAGEKYVIYFWKNLVNYLEKNCTNVIDEPDAVIRDPIKKLKINLCENCLEYRIKIGKM